MYPAATKGARRRYPTGENCPEPADPAARMATRPTVCNRRDAIPTPPTDYGISRPAKQPIDDESWFSQFFTRTDLFESLRDYYNEAAYRSEIPAEEFEAIRDERADEYIDLVVAENLAPYCVVIEQYTEYGDTLRDSVAHWERQGHRFFLMKDELAVRQAVEHGATRLSETDFVVGL